MHASWHSELNGTIANILSETASQIAPIGPAADEIMTPLLQLAEGGKRLRGLLLLTAHELTGNEYYEAALNTAAALELFQTAALLHDDVIDESDSRRGLPAMHRTLSKLHIESTWQGDSDHFGVSSAILGGDLALMAAGTALSKAISTLPPAIAGKVSSLYHQMGALVSAGQYLDVQAAVQSNTRISAQGEQIRQIMRAKSASYSVEFPLVIGAAINAGSQRTLELMHQVGISLGVAFQLRDDILGLIGSTAVTGKPVGDDLRSGKRTLILATALNRANSAQQSEILATIGNNDATESDIMAVISIIREVGALDWAEAEIASLEATGFAHLAKLELSPVADQRLREMLQQATRRQS